MNFCLKDGRVCLRIKDINTIAYAAPTKEYFTIILSDQKSYSKGRIASDYVNLDIAKDPPYQDYAKIQNFQKFQTKLALATFFFKQQTCGAEWLSEQLALLLSIDCSGTEASLSSSLQLSSTPSSSVLSSSLAAMPNSYSSHFPFWNPSTNNPKKASSYQLFSSAFYEKLECSPSIKELLTHEKFLKKALACILCMSNGPEILLGFLKAPFKPECQKLLLESFGKLRLSTLFGVYVPAAIEKQLEPYLLLYLRDKSPENKSRFLKQYREVLGSEVSCQQPLDEVRELQVIREAANELPLAITRSDSYQNLFEELQKVLLQKDTSLARDCFNTLIGLILEDSPQSLFQSEYSHKSMVESKTYIAYGSHEFVLWFQKSEDDSDLGAIHFDNIVTCTYGLLTYIASTEFHLNRCVTTLNSSLYKGWIPEQTLNKLMNENSIEGEWSLVPSSNKAKTFPDYMTYKFKSESGMLCSATFSTSEFTVDAVASACMELFEFKTDDELNVTKQEVTVLDIQNRLARLRSIYPTLHLELHTKDQLDLGMLSQEQILLNEAIHLSLQEDSSRNCCPNNDHDIDEDVFCSESSDFSDADSDYEDDCDPEQYSCLSSRNTPTPR